jgi:hypothetical protein
LPAHLGYGTVYTLPLYRLATLCGYRLVPSRFTPIPTARGCRLVYWLHAPLHLHDYAILRVIYRLQLLVLPLRLDRDTRLYTHGYLRTCTRCTAWTVRLRTGPRALLPHLDCSCPALYAPVGCWFTRLRLLLLWLCTGSVGSVYAVTVAPTPRLNVGRYGRVRAPVYGSRLVVRDGLVIGLVTFTPLFL